ncbi:FkbM family methyltransferase [Humitalea rosea]|uniref:FkbM family methyltransferase n=1 Tax=Humitalea rosea TaxID=990373 RepID=A0A2W7IPJ7_9PROT|nr:FkbM family methyltransferase [Humitalea rosea]PZW49172.1 FkbM family methyltransferase [Humitalea rosea]
MIRTTARLLEFCWRQGGWPAILRMLRWQVGGRITGMPSIAPFIGGTRLVLRRGLSSATAAHYVGLTDPAEMMLCLHLLRPGDRMTDVGANIGIYTLLAAGVCGAQVVAVEPSPGTLPHLADTIALNGIGDRVTVHAVALGAATGRLRITSRRGAANRVLLPGETDAAEEVPVTTLDALGPAPLLLKLDVEGYEAEILRGGPNTLADPTLRAVIVETNGHGARWGGDAATLHGLMLAAGFVAADYDPATRRLSRREGPGFPNTVFVRDWDWVSARLASGRNGV